MSARAVTLAVALLATLTTAPARTTTSAHTTTPGLATKLALTTSLALVTTLAATPVLAATPAFAQTPTPAAPAPATSAPAPASATSAPAPRGRVVSEQEVHEVAAELRCVVCQTLSVADSPSEMAGQMRGIVRERLAAGDSPAQVRQYFVERYGDWILLAPPRRGFTLLVWLAPFVAVLVGVVIVALRLKRWTRRRRPTPPPIDPAMRERIQRELEREA